jgi:hypothetical protein
MIRFVIMACQQKDQLVLERNSRPGKFFLVAIVPNPSLHSMNQILKWDLL